MNPVTAIKISFFIDTPLWTPLHTPHNYKNSVIAPVGAISKPRAAQLGVSAA
ncbi:MAG: hypothetical protein ABJA83_04075 [Burkholderiaceae bacterium]